MTPDTIRDLFLAFLGNAVLIGAIAYWIKSRADAQKADAESRKDSRIKQLEIQLIQVQAQREKSASDEKQTSELIASNNQLLVMLAKTQDDLYATRELYETNYKVLKGIYDRNNQEIRAIIEGSILRLENIIENARKEFGKVITNVRTGMKEDLQAAVLQNQAMAATRTILTTWDIGFKFPEESDRRWQRCQIVFTHTEALTIYKLPIMNTDNHVSTIKTGITGWFISERYSCLTGWGFFRDEHSPDIRGCFLTSGTMLENCQHLSSGATSKIPTIAVNPAIG